MNGSQVLNCTALHCLAETWPISGMHIPCVDTRAWPEVRSHHTGLPSYVIMVLLSAGVSATADADGFLQYQRPEGKSGGHGVGWSEIPRYSFRVPQGWEETPVSIADLGGTEASRDTRTHFLYY